MTRLFYIFHQLKRRVKTRHCLGGLGLLAALTWLFVFAYPDDKLHLVFCNVGQGDAILISRRFNQVLIDGGPDESVLACLSDNMPFWDKTVEIVALTHPQADHLTGLLSVLERYKVDYFLSPPAGNESAGYAKLVQLVKLDESVKVRNVYGGDSIKIGGMTFKTLWPEKDWALAQLNLPKFPLDTLGTFDTLDTFGTTGTAVLGASTTRNLNDFSLVFHLKFGDFDALLTGDADSKVQDEMSIDFSIPQVEVLKIPHHGSKYSMIDEFLQAAKPNLAIMSVGKNSFGHPAQELLDQLKTSGVDFLRTDQDGSIEIVSNGQKWGIAR